MDRSTPPPARTASTRPPARHLRRFSLAAALACALGAAQAQAEGVQAQARNAAIADGVTTAIGLAAGAAEMNPLGPVLSVALKTLAFQYAKSLPDTERPVVYAAASSLWEGAAANNLCVTAAVLTGGSFAPVCVLVGAAWAVRAWRETEHERQFWQACAMVREYTQQPQLECVYQPPGPALRVTEVPTLVGSAAEAGAD